VQRFIDRKLTPSPPAGRPLQKLTTLIVPPPPQPRVSLAKHLRTAPATVIDAHGEQHETAGLIKALHQAGGAPLLPRPATPAQPLRKNAPQPTAVQLPGPEQAPQRFLTPAALEAECWAAEAAQVHADRRSLVDAIKAATPFQLTPNRRP